MRRMRVNDERLTVVHNSCSDSFACVAKGPSGLYIKIQFWDASRLSSVILQGMINNHFHGDFKCDNTEIMAKHGANSVITATTCDDHFPLPSIYHSIMTDLVDNSQPN